MEKYTIHINNKGLYNLRINVMKYVQENYKTGYKDIEGLHKW